MTIAAGFLQTVTGVVPASDLGLVLPHEHLFNDLSSVLDAPSYRFSEPIVSEKVAAGIQWALRQDPYCCADNIADKSVDDVVTEIESFQRLGGRTVVDATGSETIGRNPERLRAVAERVGFNVVMACGAYLEKFEGERITARSVDDQAALISSELTHGVGDTGIIPGFIGEIGVSPDFTDGEKASLRAAAIAQTEHSHIAFNVHTPGWQRRAHEILDIVLDEIGVRPEKVSLAHMDPSVLDPDYQRSVADRGVYLEFDMVGMDITYPKEGVSPDPATTAAGIASLIADGYSSQLLLSHDVFLKQMWVQHGGNGFSYVPAVFEEILVNLGCDRDVVQSINRENCVAYLTS